MAYRFQKGDKSRLTKKVFSIRCYTKSKKNGILHMTQKVVYSLLERVPANVE